jgi:hypothetical protein
MYQNDMKIQKNINLKLKNLIFFKNAFKTQKQNLTKLSYKNM